MKKIITILLLAISFSAYCQEEKEEVFLQIEKQPEYPGGFKNMFQFLAENVKYPVNAMDLNIQGIVYVSFVVTREGKISDVSVLKGISKECDEEAVRVVKLFPDWIPGEQKGKKVNVKYTIPIKFKLIANSEPDSVFVEVDQQPEYPGGVNNLFSYLSKNFKYPITAIDKKIEGQVIVDFVVTKEGRIINVEIKKSLSEECDQEAIRIVQQMPDWKPGEQGGKLVNVKLTLPVNFKLMNEQKEMYKVSVDEVQPEFPGGIEKLFQFLGENVRYPKEAVDNNIQGTVIVDFLVTKEGKIEDPKILRGISRECDKEVIRVVGLMPDWKPGEQGGKPVDVRYQMPVRFKLSD